MPTYRYECERGHALERFESIAEMEAFEAKPQTCEMCGTPWVRSLRIGKPIIFHEGFFEHVSEKGAYCSSMDELKRAAYHGGTYSQYVKDLGGAFPGAKEGRWI